MTLTLHVLTSVGWIGAVVVFAGLAGLALSSTDPALVRGAYLVMAPLGWWVLVPLAAGSLLTGLVQGWGTAWGLWRHYWVAVKLVTTLVATGILLAFTQTLGLLERQARTTPDAQVLDRLPDPAPLVHSIGALVLLVMALILSIYRPRGLTRRGRRLRAARTGASAEAVSSNGPVRAIEA